MIARSCRSVPLRKTRSSFNVTASDTTEGMVVCEGSVTPQSRPRLLITHGACSGVAYGILALRLLPHESFCISLLSQNLLVYNRPLRILAGRFLLASIEPSELFKFRLSGQFQALYLTANCVGHRPGSGPRPS